MNLYGIDIIKFGEPSGKRLVVALGFFDCIHVGHQALIEEAKIKATGLHAEPALFTFSNDPFVLLGNGKKPVLTFEERLNELGRTGVKNVVVAEFNEELMNTSGETFFAGLIKTGAVGIVCGRDYTCGVKGSTGTDELKTMAEKDGVDLTVKGDVFVGGEKVSSTAVRKALIEGDLPRANALLGKPYVIGSSVIKGDGLGRTFGFPTANLLVPEEKLLPASGVYAAKTDVDGKNYVAALHIGERPTISRGERRIEAFLSGFDGDLYGRKLYLELDRKIRDVKKFDSVDRLKLQIARDVKKAQKYAEERGNDD